MPGYTTPDNLAIPLAGETASPRTQVTALADTTQAAFAKRQIHTFQFPSTATMNATPGDAYGDIAMNFETNLLMTWVTPGAWQPLNGTLTPGMYAITPTTVGGSIVGGKVVYSAVTSLTVENCFSSTFENYVLVIDNTASAGDGDMSIQLRSGGSAIAGTAYAGSGMEAAVGIGPGLAAQSGASAARTGRVATSGSSCRMEVFSPFTTNASGKRGLFQSIDRAVYNRNGGWICNSAASCTGFQLTFTVATTGKLAVYGYA